MSRLDLVPCLLLVAVACGGEPNTSITDSASSSGSTGAVVTTGDPTPLTGTGSTGDTTADTLTGGQSGTASSSGSDTTAEPTTGEQTGTSTTFGTETATTATSTGAPETTTTGDDTTGDDTTGGFIDCPTLKADFQAELAELASCVDAAECGQELKGTSCGCTNNIVARLDADRTKLDEILMLAEQHSCELILAGTCDCPAADGFVCNNGFCGWNYL